LSLSARRLPLAAIWRLTPLTALQGFAPFFSISPRIHFLILLEAALALALIGYVAWIQSRRIPLGARHRITVPSACPSPEGAAA
jgi:hypothetical protein